MASQLASVVRQVTSPVSKELVPAQSPTGQSPASPGLVSALSETVNIADVCAKQEESMIQRSLPVAPGDPKKTRKLRQRMGREEQESIPHVQDVLDRFIPVQEWLDTQGTKWTQSASPHPASRLDAVILGEKLDTALREARARPTGICPARRALYQDAFSELVRQVTADSVERGILLQKIREEREVTIRGYEGLLESRAGYAFRIALKGEKDAYKIKSRIEELKQKKTELLEEEERLKAAEVAVKAEGEEMFKADDKRRKDEISALLKDTNMKKTQLEAIVTIPKK